MNARFVLPIVLLSATLLALGARAGNPMRVSVAAPLELAQTVPASPAAVALEWYALTLNLVRHTATYSPPVASRTFGYLGVTLFEIAAARGQKLRSLAGQLNGFTGVPQPVAGAIYDDATVVHAALSNSVSALFSNTGPTGQRALTAVTSRSLNTVSKGVPEEVLQRSLEYGKAVSAAVMKWAATDGGAEITNLGFPLSYPRASSPEEWVPTGTLGLQQVPLLPAWGTNRPFAMKGGDTCALPAPIPYSTEKDSAFYKEALEVYTVTKSLTSGQRDIAAFWDDSAMLSMTPPGHWIGILSDIFRDTNANFETMAEGYARVGMAVADAFIGCWNTKFQFNLLRPITYIQRVIDPKWTPMLITPSFPEYPSGHSAQSGAVATVLTAFLGDKYAFTDHTHDDDGLEARGFASFWDAANEAGISRMYGGIHFRTAVERGLEQGRCVGAKINALQFKR
jgi:membrane-associated phospholipid phosphatase